MGTAGRARRRPGGVGRAPRPFPVGSGPILMARARGRFLRQGLIPVCLVLGSATVTLLVGELLARSVVHSGDFLLATLVEDPALGLRTVPNTTGHDALGFRNLDVPQHAAIVAIG